MWSAFIRQFAAYALTRRGKRLFALAGVLLLCFAGALLIDMAYYVSASFTAVLAGVSALIWMSQHVKLRRAERERLQRKAEQARQRAIAAQARLERIDTAKSTVSGAVQGAARAVTDAVDGVVNEAAQIAQDTAQAATGAAKAVSGAAQTVASAPANLARAGIFQLVKTWRALKKEDV